MKKVLYLFAVALMGFMVACGGAAEKGCAAECAKECCVVAEEAPAEEAAAEKVGCQVEGGTCLEDHSCCAPAEEATCCCGDAECDGSCHAEGEDHGHEH